MKKQNGPRTGAMLLSAAFIALALGGCGNGAAGVSSSQISEAPSSAPPFNSVASTPAPPASVADAPQSAVPDEAFVDTGLLSVPGGVIADLREACSADSYGEDYYMWHIGEFGAAMEYYDPYIYIYFDPVTVFGSNMDVSDDSIETDPFKRDDLTVYGILLQGIYDPATHQMTDQDSLRRLFVTEAPITYALLAENLGQEPALEHNPEGWWQPALENEMGTGETIAVEGGTYSAVYRIDGVKVEVSYIKTEDGYVAIRAYIDAEMQGHTG